MSETLKKNIKKGFSRHLAQFYEKTKAFPKSLHRPVTVE